MSEEMLKELLIEHSEFPCNQGKPKEFSHECCVDQPETGDAVTLWLSVDSDYISRIHWQATGSRLLYASCSIMSEYLVGKMIADAKADARKFVQVLTGEIKPEDIDAYGIAAALFSVRHLPARVRCVTLPWRCLLGV